MTSIAISAGHHPNAKGANDGQGFNEYDEASKWIELIKNLFDSKTSVNALVIPTGYLSSKIKYINTTGRRAGIKLALELHFNAAPGTNAKGCETLYCPGSYAGKNLANTIQSTLASFMPPNRGIKEGWYRQDRPGRVDYYGDIDGDESIVAFLSKTFCPAVILEPEFIHNKAVIESNREICCEVIFETLCDYLGVSYA
jgi:hypothetical protein